MTASLLCMLVFACSYFIFCAASGILDRPASQNILLLHAFIIGSCFFLPIFIGAYHLYSHYCLNIPGKIATELEELDINYPIFVSNPLISAIIQNSSTQELSEVAINIPQQISNDLEGVQKTTNHSRLYLPTVAKAIYDKAFARFTIWSLSNTQINKDKAEDRAKFISKALLDNQEEREHAPSNHKYKWV